MVGRIVRWFIKRSVPSRMRRTIRKLIILWDAAGEERPYCCFLIYRKRDPFAVTLLVPDHTTTGKVTEILFERGLLLIGIHEPAGDGAVRVEPHIVDRDYMTLTLPVTRDGREFYTDLGPMQEFVDDSCALVPSGSELAQVNLDLDCWLSEVAL